MVESGRLRHHGKFQVKSVSRNSYNEEEHTWIDDKEANVGIEPILGKEYHFAQQTQAAVTHRIVMRYTKLNNGDKIHPNCRFVSDDGDIYNIKSALDPEMRHIDLILMVTESL